MMRWKRVDRAERVQPKRGTYVDWKEQIADECGQQCVYCAIPESRNGGLDNFHIDHFRPKSRPEFEHLRDNIHNLFLSCAPCNRFKHDDWPGEPLPDHSASAYPDPSEHDYNNLFDVCPTSNTVQGRHVASQYVVERLYLNRPQLIRERRLSRLEENFAKQRTLAEGLVQELIASRANYQLLEEVLRCLFKVMKQLEAVCRSRPYSLKEIRRPK